MAIAYAKSHVKVADELFLIVALLHREQPQKEAFTVGEILHRASTEGLGSAQGSLRAHASGHAAANVAPDGRGGRYRMVFRQEDKRIRLLGPDDFVHPDRHQKFYPEPDEIPEKYHELLEWAKRRQEKGKGAPVTSQWLTGLYELRGLGKETWKGVDADQYVKNLREGWE
jgi:hypothetical protein